jgi:hypothetical protein
MPSLDQVFDFAGDASAVAVFLFMLMLHDAALLFCSLAAAVCFFFPEWWFIFAPAALLGLVRILVTYDPSLGDLSGMMGAVFDQLSLTVDITLLAVLMVAFFPFVRAAMTLSLLDLPSRVARFAPLLVLVCVKMMGERVSDLNYIAESALLVAGQGADTVRMWWHYAALLLFSK